ncbi:MAG: DUF4138 domain-containing protein [Phycisphaerales bacterium]|nr:DUF4138 domain-containing protein [Phycisphaerales bacterium]
MYKNAIYVFSLIVICYYATAQEWNIDSIPVTGYKHTILSFHKKIAHYTIGTKSVQVFSSIEGGKNLLLQAKKPNEVQPFVTTNLTVIFEDSSLYSADIYYKEGLKTYVFHMIESTSEPIAISPIKNEEINDNKVSVKEKHIEKDSIKQQRTVYGFFDTYYGVKADVYAITTDGDNTYMFIRLKNNTDIRYSVNAISIVNFVKKNTKLASNQETTIPYESISWQNNIDPHKHFDYILKIKKLVLSKEQLLKLSILEESNVGNRKLKISIPPFFINHSKFVKL